ncbi:hypothetical protein MAR_038078 [Mya arenaria]|uniref:Uncharacterized protein n=1 Tax=Mya arenaria TaxID=6604 RepID=A0ABY7FU73_MYAAR|nr:hypothetical protein MAR_038078 [Mya arenaria]
MTGIWENCKFKPRCLTLQPASCVRTCTSDATVEKSQGLQQLRNMA